MITIKMSADHVRSTAEGNVFHRCLSFCSRQAPTTQKDVKLEWHIDGTRISIRYAPIGV